MSTEQELERILNEVKKIESILNDSVNDLNVIEQGLEQLRNDTLNVNNNVSQCYGMLYDDIIPAIEDIIENVSSSSLSSSDKPLPVEIIIDDKDSGFSFNGQWNKSAAVDCYNGRSLWNATQGQVATWKF